MNMLFAAHVKGGKTANANGGDKGNEQVQVYDLIENSKIFTKLDNVVTSMLQNQDFSSYSMENLEVAKAWFLNPSNHPIGKSSIHKRSEADPSNDKYMKIAKKIANCQLANGYQQVTIASGLVSNVIASKKSQP